VADGRAWHPLEDAVPQPDLRDTVVQHQCPDLFHRGHRPAPGLLAGPQQSGVAIVGLIVDAGDQLVLHLDQSVDGFRQRHLKKAHHDGVALGGREAAEMPDGVAIGPGGQQPARGGMHAVQGRQRRHFQSRQLGKPIQQ
jgi:hypothetical protein